MSDEIRANADNAIEAGLRRAVRSDKAKLALAARMQLDAEAGGAVLDIEPAHGREARRFLRQDAIVGASFDRLAQRYG